MNRRPKEVAIAGSGFAGAVLARQLAESKRFKVTIFEERSHVAGNCHTARDARTGVLLHQYGPHIFHTDRTDVWSYVNRFAAFGPYVNRVKAVTTGGVFSLPINLLTINQFFGRRFSPAEAKSFIASRAVKSITDPKNFEEQALSLIGPELYENFLHGYTRKQWGVDPREIPASIIKRLPIRFNYDDNYYSSKYQGIPLEGYSALVEKILDHPGIRVRLGERFATEYRRDFSHSFYSGPLDSYFNFALGRLGYRSLIFERIDAMGDFQGNPVINYCEESVPYTRISEHKHFAPWETHSSTVCFREFSKMAEGNEVRFYPLRLKHDLKLFRDYVALAKKTRALTFIGRLGTYRYRDMDAVIGESLDLARLCLRTEMKAWPSFSVDVAPVLPEARPSVGPARNRSSRPSDTKNPDRFITS